MPSDRSDPETGVTSHRVSPSEAGQRLDKFIMEKTPDWISRNLIQKAIKEKKVLVDKKDKKASYKLKEGESVRLEIPKPEPYEAEPENIPLEIIYEDNDIILINKPPDMIVHPVPHNASGTLVNALLYHFSSLSDWEDKERPGIVHRLDRDTSGIMIVAKHQRALQNLSRQFHDRKNLKYYIAILDGTLKEKSGIVEKPLGRNPRNRLKMMVDYSGKDALTEYRVLKAFKDMASLVLIRIKTGRTHQIRVHFKSLNAPVLGDQVYGFGKKTPPVICERQMLHALKLGIYHPITGKWMVFNAPLPEDFKGTLRTLADSL